MALPVGITRAYDYDAASRLTALHYVQNGTPIGELLYTYDAAGLRTSVSGSLARVDLPQPVTATSYDAGNRVTDWNGESETYDQNGNILTAGLTTYQWNARDQLVGVSGPAITATFAYDPMGRRVQKVVNGVTSSYAFDKSTFVREVVGNQTVRYLTGLRVDEYLNRNDGGTSAVFITDAIGSTVSLQPATGAGTDYSYEPFGSTTAAGTTSSSPIGFTGREVDGSSLYYYRARYYDTNRMRFLSEDPLEYAAGQNLYAYVHDSPINLTDPYGTIPIPGLNYFFCFWYSAKCSDAGQACKKALREKYRDKTLLEMLECESEGRKDLFKGEDELYFTKCFLQLPECHNMWEYCGKSAVAPPPFSTRPGGPPTGDLPGGNLPGKPPLLPGR
jgi:RHS repeat-associated protein